MTRHLIRGRLRTGDRGVVIVLTAICSMALVMMLALVIDVGSWYWRADKLQRSADAAALAAASKLPSTIDAVAAATDSLAKNGYVNGVDGTSIAVAPMSSSHVKVDVELGNVPTIFGRMVFDHIVLHRTANAESLSQLALGSPANVFGEGDLALPGDYTPGSSQNYWAAVNGFCTAKEDGDYRLSRYDGNKTATKTLCDAGQEQNPNYDPNGYDYIIDVPGTSPAPLKVRLYDPVFAAGKAGSPDASAARSDDADPHITTTFTLSDYATGTVMATRTFDSDSPPAGSVAAWFDLYSNLSSAKHKYRLNVRTKANEDRSWGVNAYAVWVQRSGTAESLCDVRWTMGCPQVYALGAMSIYGNLQPKNDTSVFFYLADIGTQYAGHPLTIDLWDPGEGTEGMKVLVPNIPQPMYVSWHAVPWSNDPNLHGDYDSFIDFKGTASSGTGPGRYGTGLWNDRMLEINTQIPDDYVNHIAADGTTWWVIQYIVMPQGSPSDRTTWSTAVGGSPVYLVRNDS